MTQPAFGQNVRDLVPVFAVSCGLLGFEISLMRILLYASWHHFAFLIISVALLGFGTSGTVLSFLRAWLLRRADGALVVLVIASALSMPVSIQILKHIPVEARFVPTLLAAQIGLWVLFWTVLFVPFLLGASAIGLALIAAGRRIPVVYAANLTGSAFGALAAPLAMHFIPPAWLGAAVGAVTLSGVLTVKGIGTARRIAALVPAVAVVAAWLAADGPEIRIDPFKYQSYVNRLAQSSPESEDDSGAVPLVSRAAEAYGPRAVIDVYEGGVFHELSFLSPGVSPPPMMALLLDGHWAGSILRVRRADDAGAVENTLMSTAYSFIPPRPHVLLLGETGGANIWLAVRYRSAVVDVVQPNGKLIDLLGGPLYEKGGLVTDLPAIEMVAEEPRHFVDHSTKRFDLIHLAGLESWAVETGGVAGLRENNLITVEGLSACLGSLSPDGLLSVCRAIQIPPRDNIKLIATLIEALRRTGIDSPGRHIAVVRDFLGVCTLVKTAPWSASEIDSLRGLCRRRQLTPVYFTGIRDDEFNYPDKLPGPPGVKDDWLHHAVVMLLSSRPDEARGFMNDWPFDIRPPTDDRPFFDNFGKLASTGVLMDTFGDLWLTRTELSLLFILVAACIICLFGAVLTVIPLVCVAEIRRSAGRTVTSLYFACIGLGYLMLEITMLSRLTRLIGDPVTAGAVTIAGFLFFSGLGSFTARKTAAPDSERVDSRPRLISTAAGRLLLALVLVGAVELWALEWSVVKMGHYGPLWRIIAAIIAIAPLGYLMGFPLPLGLRRLGSGAPHLVPWAWGVNGFASVLAPVFATAIAMMWGFRVAGSLALFFYAVAWLLPDRLPGAARR